MQGRIQILAGNGRNLQILFTSLDGTSSRLVSGRAAAEHFIAQTLGCSLKPEEMDRLMSDQLPNGIEAQIKLDQYVAYFSK